VTRLAAKAGTAITAKNNKRASFRTLHLPQITAHTRPFVKLLQKQRNALLKVALQPWMDVVFKLSQR
jgi:hypothetical protein